MGKRGPKPKLPRVGGGIYFTEENQDLLERLLFIKKETDIPFNVIMMIIMRSWLGMELNRKERSQFDRIDAAVNTQGD